MKQGTPLGGNNNHVEGPYKLQMQRRRMALRLLPGTIPTYGRTSVKVALELVDELIKATDTSVDPYAKKRDILDDPE